MMRIKTALLCLVIGLLISMGTEGIARDDGQAKGKNTLAKVLGNPSTTRLNINNVSHWFGADLLSANDPRTGNSGLESPRGISPTLATIFIDGLVYGGLVDDGRTPALRVGGQNYAIGTVAGAVLANGTAEDPEAADVRIYRVRKDYATADLTLDAEELGLDVATVRAQYATDWREWPSQKGAPWTGIGNQQDSGYLGPDGTTVSGAGNGVLDRGEDANSNAILDAGEDANGNKVLDGEFPGIAGGDQVVWTVANDLSEGSVSGFSGSLPIGLEIQLAAWGYQRTDALGNMVFKQFKIIYKGTATTPANATVNPMYVCQWSDPDLGSYSDDFVGVDSTLSLFYCYNSTSTDGAYAAFGFPPPSSGYDFFQGPLVPGAPEDVGIFNLQRRPGFRNLPMSSFAYFAAQATFSDPAPLGNYETTQEWWNLLRGFLPQSDFNNPSPYTQNDGVTPTSFPLFGDPVTGIGDLDGTLLPPSDRRMLGVSGPFTLSVGDTQEVVVATIFALGSDRLSSVAVLRFFDRTAQSTFDNLFQVIRPPGAPVVQASGFENQILLNWATDAAAVAATESQAQGSFSFEGYNVYQLRTNSPDIGPGNAIKLATFDVVNEVTTVLSEAFDQVSGVIIQRPVQIGTNSGIQRTFVVNRDAFRDRPLANDQDYFFAVTAYNATLDLAETNRAFESAPLVIAVRAQKPRPGVRYAANSGDVLDFEHTAGGSDGSIIPLVVDPSRLTGHTYQVTFKDVEGQIVWDLTDVTAGIVLLADQTNQSGDNDYFIVDGVQVKVTGPPNDFKRFAMTVNGNGPITETFGFEATPPPTTYTGYSADWYRDVLTTPNGGSLVLDAMQAGGGFFFIVAGGPNITGHAAAVGRLLRNGANAPTVIPNDYEIRFTNEPDNMGVWVSEFGDTAPGTRPVPFELWFLGPGTLDDPSDDIRMIPVLLDDGGSETEWDFKLDHQASGGNNDPYSDWIYFYMPADETPGESGYQAAIATNPTTRDAGWHEHIARLVIMNWNQFQGGGGVNEAVDPGTVFRIETNKINLPADAFTFTTPAPSFDPNQQKQDALALVNVFPNPYLGLNRLETSSTNRFIRFNHLPANSTIRIFNLAGTLVRTLPAASQVDQYMDWDLQNERQLPVASGIYIARVEMPGVGSKNLKVIVIQEEQFLRTF